MANLTPEQLARLRQMVQQGGQAEYYDEASGRSFMPTFAPGRYEGENYIPGDVTGYRGYEWAPGMYSDNFELNGKQYDQFDAQGNQTGQGTWEGLKKNSAMDTLLPLAMVAAPFALTAMGVAGAGAAGGYGALGATEPIASIGASGGMTSAELAAMGAAGGGAGGSGAFLGEGLASGVPAWDTAATSAGLGLSGGASLLGDAASAATGASKWLGPASTLLGGLAGAQGQKTEETSQRRTDPRVDPYLFGANGQPGLLQMTYDKLVGQMAPGGLQGYDDMQRVGMGLLNAPVAGNGFGLFTKGKY